LRIGYSTTVCVAREGGGVANGSTPETTSARQSLEELGDLVADGRLLAALSHASGDTSLWERAKADTRAYLLEAGVRLPPSMDVRFADEPPSLPPVVVGAPKPFRRCVTVCHQIGPADPRDPDPTRFTWCYTICLPWAGDQRPPLPPRPVRPGGG
jgi:hypothetical protein